ncbi:MAG: YbaB/EbfC family nucleoid-associated protein [Firmicutes bacterium]|nr:YbaB/EbfC family nucleoid-associated protein [Bacillota bacterium]
MNLADMNRMMKQFQKMQEEMAKAQERLAEIEVEGSAGGGAVKAYCTGKQEMRRIEIDPAAVDPNDVDMLQDLVLAAVNDALRKSQERAAQELARVTGGLQLPPGLPF